MNPAPPVYIEPEVWVRHWALIRQRGYGYFLIGARVDTARVRVTTAVEEIDYGQMTIRTRSGRLYHLAGKPNSHVARLIAPRIARSMGISPSDLTVVYFGEPLEHGFDPPRVILPKPH